MLLGPGFEERRQLRIAAVADDHLEGDGFGVVDLDPAGLGVDEDVDAVGLGRMILTYPELLWDAAEGKTVEHKRICRTFSDCTTAPRKGLPSGCYPLDSYYKSSELAERLKIAKAKR